MDGVTNGQRALWMVLMTSLAAPFFASLVDVAMTLASPLLDFALPPRGEKSLGEVAVNAFVWSAFPATFAGLALLPFVLQHGTYDWLHAAIAGVVAFAAAQFVWPIAPGGMPVLLAFLAGLIAILMRTILINGGILKL
jgi:hypothetical protein